MKTITIYVPSGMPGDSPVDQARYTVAAAFAEVRDGMDAEPSTDDLLRAALFTYRLVGDLSEEYRFEVTGEDATVDAYEAALEEIS